MTKSGPELITTRYKKHFSSLKEPRRTKKGNFTYPLEEIILLTISAVICGCSTWTAIAEFGKLKLDWLRKFHSYENGTPSHDAISDLFAILDPIIFGKCFTNWVNSVAKNSESEVIAFDGKTIRGVGSNSRKFPIHIVTAFCTTNRLTLGQQSVEDKSNEIIAIPKLLDFLTLEGCIITTDAMGCQEEIAKKIISKGADYILQVKGNQKELKEQIIKVFARNTARKKDTSNDIGHGRTETRICEVVSNLEFLDGKEKWKNLTSIIRIKSIRGIKSTGSNSNEFRYYISSLNDNARRLNHSIRSHWGIENNLHWGLDVIFKEDGQLKRKGNSAENFNIINKAALGLLENETSLNKTKPLKMLRAALSDKYREKIMKV